jgi:hypothetical protein
MEQYEEDEPQGDEQLEDSDDSGQQPDNLSGKGSPFGWSRSQGSMYEAVL